MQPKPIQNQIYSQNQNSINIESKFDQNTFKNNNRNYF